jgi:hypothetical protein
MSTVVDGLLVTVIGGPIVSAILAIFLRIDIRPKIEIKYRFVATGSHGDQGKLDCKWYGVLSFYNPTPFTAYNIQFILPPNWSLPVPKLDPPRLADGETKEISFDISKVLQKSETYPSVSEQLQPHSNPLPGDTLQCRCPVQLRNFMLCAKYSNGHWFSMYSRFIRRDEQQTCTHHIVRPKV